MFILKRQDVEISSIQHPKRKQNIPILTYQGQNFRLISVFSDHQQEEAKAFWRELTDHRGKACVLLEETDRYSIWGKVSLEQLKAQEGSDSAVLTYTKACILVLQAVYIDVEDLLGGRQAGLFEKEITNLFEKWQFPQADSAKAVKHWLNVDPLANASVPAWEEHHLITLLQELYRLGKEYFGNTNFAQGVRDILQDMPVNEQKQFINWLNQSALGQLWQ
ncbi:MAG: hypothetical protein F6K58_31315 [Symploca sp. SIO2E9]|nr:hypothetical protein [Symploca sp. SIO2E9]